MVRKFCVVCGREDGEFIGSLCLDCYIKTKELVQVPKEIHGKYCKICGSEWVEGKWVKPNDPSMSVFESIVYRELGKRVKLDDNVEEVDYNIINQHYDQHGHLFVNIEIKGKVRGKEFRVIKTVNAKIERTICPSCIRKKGHYYEAIIQLRFKEGKLDANKRQVFESFFNEEVIDSLSDVIEGKEGVDYYFIKKSVAKKLVSTVSSTLKDIKITESYQDERMKNGKKSAKTVISVRL
ncbi:60S ribosomal export protein NMD3 [Sulfolobaceae archaeon RB850M]